MELPKEFRERFVRTLQGRDYVLYGGLLELARQRGLKRITTNVIQVPSKENGMYAVVEAEVETQDGVFKEVGDASPESVNRTIQPHLLRMAATRAKSRALRDSIGIDMVAWEELGGQVPPEEDIPDIIDPEDLVIGFGKYARRTLGEILQRDPGYIEWLGQNARDEAIRKAVKQLLYGGLAAAPPGAQAQGPPEPGVGNRLEPGAPEEPKLGPGPGRTATH
ncbi:MAG: hypothetical protein HPY71_03685 [Firmicutes bacterium]|nr:hypothetical protein [Bacillota bacterium]